MYKKLFRRRTPRKFVILTDEQVKKINVAIIKQRLQNLYNKMK